MVHYHGHLLYKVRATYTTHRALCSTPKWHATSDSTTHAQRTLLDTYQVHLLGTRQVHLVGTYAQYHLVVRCSYRMAVKRSQIVISDTHRMTVDDK